mmetsp:Transcript_38289/g.85913  ORF Transcript_38289/g.85913 Transcript_38289/m.85913 type:complete len:244 (-) Transcript_38289:560-1291(-)
MCCELEWTMAPSWLSESESSLAASPWRLRSCPRSRSSCIQYCSNSKKYRPTFVFKFPLALIVLRCPSNACRTSGRCLTDSRIKGINCDVQGSRLTGSVTSISQGTLYFHCCAQRCKHSSVAVTKTKMLSDSDPAAPRDSRTRNRAFMTSFTTSTRRSNVATQNWMDLRMAYRRLRYLYAFIAMKISTRLRSAAFSADILLFRGARRTTRSNIVRTSLSENSRRPAAKKRGEHGFGTAMATLHG